MNFNIGDKIKYNNTGGYIISIPNDTTVCLNTFEGTDICVETKEAQLWQ